MDDQTNQGIEAEVMFFEDVAESVAGEDVGESADVGEGAAEDATDAVAETEKTSGEAKPTGDTGGEAKYKVKYNGRESELTLAELITHAQKGMNYDHVLSERDRYKNAPEFALLDRYAKSAGMSREDCVKYLENSIKDTAVAELVEQGMPKEAALELYELRQSAKEQREHRELERQEKAAADEKMKALFEFHAAYPEVKTLPPEVVAEIAAGKTPLAAYQAYEISRLSLELATERKNAGNKKAAIGSVKDGAAVLPGDDFLTGWNNA